MRGFVIYQNKLWFGSSLYNGVELSKFWQPLYKEKNYLETLDWITDQALKLWDGEIWFNDFHEVMPLQWLHELGVLELLGEKFKDRNFTITDCNLSNNLPDFLTKHQYIGRPYFLGMMSEHNFPIEENSRLFKNHFLSLNGSSRIHRQMLYQYLYDFNLLNKCTYSFYVYDPTHPFHHMVEDDFLDKIEDSAQLNQRPDYTPNNLYKNSFSNLLTETFFLKDSSDFNGVIPSTIFFTEKLIKCFVAGQPFFLISTANSLKKIHELGFQTFGKWWDESYDLIEDDLKRLDFICHQALEISKIPLVYLNNIYNEMIPILKHNQELNSKFKEENQKIAFSNFPNETNEKIVYVSY